MKSGCVPIYLGAINICDYINPNLFIDKRNFKSYSELLNFLTNFSENDYKNFILNSNEYLISLDFNKLSKDMEEFVEEEKENLFLTTLDDEYKTFIDAKEEQLQKEYNELHEFQTNTRGIKVRGVFGSQEEAEMRCKMLREQDPNHDVYVGAVGMWMPFHPEAYKTGRVEYLEKDLNEWKDKYFEALQELIKVKAELEGTMLRLSHMEMHEEGLDDI